jgi:hypothetical protein
MVSTGVAQACVEMRTLRSSTHYLDQRRADSIMARSIAPQTGRIHLRRPTPLTPEDSACNLAADHTISTPPTAATASQLVRRLRYTNNPTGTKCRVGHLQTLVWQRANIS